MCPQGGKQHPNSHPPCFDEHTSAYFHTGNISESSLGHLQGSHHVAQKRNTISWSSASWNAASKPSLFSVSCGISASGGGCVSVCCESKDATPAAWSSPSPQSLEYMINLSWNCDPAVTSAKVKSENEVTQSCPTHCSPMDCSLPGSSVHGILQARILEWVAISFSRGSSQPRDWTWVSCIVGSYQGSLTLPILFQHVH